MPSLICGVASKPSAAIEQLLCRSGRLRIRITRVRSRGQHVQQPEQRTQHDVLGIQELLQLELLARLRHAGDDAAIVDARAVCNGGVEQVDPLRCQLQHGALVAFDFAEVQPRRVVAVEADAAEQALGEAIERACPRHPANRRARRSAQRPWPRREWRRGPVPTSPARSAPAAASGPGWSRSGWPAACRGAAWRRKWPSSSGRRCALRSHRARS